MTTWRRGSSELFWHYKTAGVDRHVKCNPDGWVRIEDHKPDYGWRVLVVGQSIFSDSSARRQVLIDQRRKDDAGEFWGKARLVTYWQPLPKIPEMPR